MCGITGLIHPNHPEYIRQMTDLIAHRGPDDEGFFSDTYISFGHRRLAIQDLSQNGHQPMITLDGRFMIILNGEIYNHFDIRKRLEEKYIFRSTSDTETILYGFVEYGVSLFNMLNGIFAFAIYDKLTHDLIIVRDQYGVKPLYYYHKNDILVFASEIKSILTVPEIDKSIDYKGLTQYLRILWGPGERTMLNNISKLLPGYYLKCNVKDPRSIEKVKYYEIPFDGQYSTKTEEQLIDELDSLLTEAVRRQLLSDVPVGFFLSGGIDSSAIVAIAKKILPNQRLKCYTIDSGSKHIIKEGFGDDLFYAHKVAQLLDVDLTVINGKADIYNSFDKMIWHLDEPEPDIASIHVMNICKQAREDGYVVLLGGTAGDDLFSGYSRHLALRYEWFIKFLPKRFFSFIKTIVGYFKSRNVFIRRLKKLLSDLDKPEIDRMVGYFTWLPEGKEKELLSENIRIKIKDFNPMAILKSTLKKIPKEKSRLNKMLFLELKHFLPDHNLNYTDKLSMACGVEVRVPFLDKDLVEFSTGIAPSFKLKGKTTKYLLKKLMERYLPNDVIYRPKAGFGAPVRSWVNNELRNSIDETLSKEGIEEDGLFDYVNVREMIDQNRKNLQDFNYPILGLVAISSWYHQFIKT